MAATLIIPVLVVAGNVLYREKNYSIMVQSILPGILSLSIFYTGPIISPFFFSDVAKAKVLTIIDEEGHLIGVLSVTVLYIVLPLSVTTAYTVDTVLDRKSRETLFRAKGVIPASAFFPINTALHYLIPVRFLL